MSLTNSETLHKIYEKYAAGDVSGMLALCHDKISFSIPGKSKLAGKYTKENFQSHFMNTLAEISNGTFKIEVHDVLASDRHGVVLNTETLESGGKTSQLRTVHVWRFENGQPVAFYEYPRDLYEFDSAWN